MFVSVIIFRDYDFRLKVMVRDMKHYQDFVLNDLGSIKNIGSAHSTFIMGVINMTMLLSCNAFTNLQWNAVYGCLCDGLRQCKLSLNNFSQVQKSFKVSLIPN
jgi:hypothetical protein